MNYINDTRGNVPCRGKFWSKLSLTYLDTDTDHLVARPSEMSEILVTYTRATCSIISVEYKLIDVIIKYKFTYAVISSKIFLNSTIPRALVCEIATTPINKQIIDTFISSEYLNMNTYLVNNLFTIEENTNTSPSPIFIYLR